MNIRRRLFTRREKQRQTAIAKALEEKSGLPKEFVHEYLSSRGWRYIDSVWCGDCDDWGDENIEHPIKFLWKHILKGCKPCFTSIHNWRRSVGRDTGIFEDCYAYYIHSWNKERNCFDCEVDEMECM